MALSDGIQLVLDDLAQHADGVTLDAHQVGDLRATLKYWQTIAASMEKALDTLSESGERAAWSVPLDGPVKGDR